VDGIVYCGKGLEAGMNYVNLWVNRPETVDCSICAGDAADRSQLHPGADADRDIHAGPCCAYTGLDEIPWSELFMIGRDQWNGE